MKIAIRYRADYHYETPVGFSPHLVRIFPRQDPAVHCERMAFSTAPDAVVQHRLDLFDNLVGRCFFPQPREHLPFHLELDLVLQPKNPFHFLLDEHALTLPFLYTPQELRVLTPYLERGESFPLPPELSPSAHPRPTVDGLTAMNTWVHQNITYERREDGDPHPPAETLRRRSASCRDFAVLFAEILRIHGVAARLVSGFLWEKPDPDTPRRAENALHAWVEAHLPGAGWVGLDPTNGLLCDHHFLATAVGLLPADVAPIVGHYYDHQTVRGWLDTALAITEH